MKGFADLGFVPPAFFFWSSFSIEMLGGICIILGLFTRFFAAAAAIEMPCIFIVYWSNGFGWMKRGYEYVLLWGLVCFAIALRGGGPYSLDRKLGRELIAASSPPLFPASATAKYCAATLNHFRLAERWLSG